MRARRGARNRVRAEVCAWLDRIEIGRGVSAVISKMLAEGVAVGRRLRVASGTEREMVKFEKEAA